MRFQHYDILPSFRNIHYMTFLLIYEYCLCPLITKLTISLAILLRCHMAIITCMSVACLVSWYNPHTHRCRHTSTYLPQFPFIITQLHGSFKAPRAFFHWLVWLLLRWPKESEFPISLVRNHQQPVR